MKISQHKRGDLYTTLTINGHKNFIYGSTPEEVDTKYTEMKYKHQQGYNVNDNPTLEKYMITWYKTFKDDKGALKTQEMYRNCINNHINPILGNKKIKEITGTQAQTLLNSIKSSKSLAHKVRITMNQIFKQAVVDRLIPTNPILSCGIIAPDDPKRKYLEPIQRELLLHILNNHRIHPIIFAILYTGIRMGEALALTWKDIDFKNNIIKITKTFEFDKSKPKSKDPKTENGIRDIPIPLELLNYLKQYKKSTKKNLYVFPGNAGGPMGLTEIKRLWRKARAKIKKWFKDEDHKDMKEHEFNLTFRLLRHTYCTGLFDAEIDEVSAAKLMGHDIKIMREIYTHLSESRKQKTKLKLDSLYKEQKVTEIKTRKRSAKGAKSST